VGDGQRSPIAVGMIQPDESDPRELSQSWRDAQSDSRVFPSASRSVPCWEAGWRPLIGTSLVAWRNGSTLPVLLLGLLWRAALLLILMAHETGDGRL